ncbi:lysozyme [Budviciaceae bacterium CWB-B4]|uniref:chitinase n=1 Tax=Limnobaculum xujianqingii TaxID=2738837 RepID=A0A9D7AF57_9GAMM|nr:glycosyl hydrolase family 18 protein [Limnobaculum xujianqingii]MBK5071540.1 lysozyme [Limnobaculum xujianqingii]MBK5174849.1 lysozyme [Limnobaculum xujianqingii]
MKMKLLSKAFMVLGFCSMASSAMALEAWSGQEGSDTFQVIYSGNVYSNAWWVGAADCPASAIQNPDSNAWRLVRAATAQEMTQYGNPTTCDVSNGAAATVSPEFDATQAYTKGTVVGIGGANYKATADIAANTFTPSKPNPWKAYAAAPGWEAGKIYDTGEIVIVNGQGYEAWFYTVGDDPSNTANQSPDGDNGRPWKPLGSLKNYTEQELSKAPVLNLQTLYPAGTLVKYQNIPYVSQAQVHLVKPDDKTLWEIFIDWTGTKERVGKPNSTWPKHVYAPYVDFTLNSIPDLASLSKSQNITHYTLAFIVAKDNNTCLPTWGTAYNINDYTQYRKIKELREAGGDVMVSIGGANNTPLAAACKNVDDLQKQYYDIVDNLNLNVLDFDIEGNWVADNESIQRRNEAVKKVQDRWRQEGRKVGIWYTLPILPTGLTQEGIYVLNDAKAKGVDLAGINVMTMDYGNSICQSAGTEGQNIHGKCATSAIDNLFTQVKAIWPEKDDATVNGMLGTTPMIGYNDVQGEVFFMSDARMVFQQAKDRNIGMIGIWSMFRDQPGTAGYVGPENSGMTEQQAPIYAYSKVFAPFTTTSGGQPVPPVTGNVPPVANAGISQTVDGSQAITLDGSGSSDQDGDALTYQWEQTGGPAVTLTGADAATATFSVEQPVQHATYKFRLTVKDPEHSAYADTTVSVVNAAQPIAPTLVLSPSWQVQSGGQAVITATASDPDSTSTQLSWSWTIPGELTQVTGQGTNTLTITAPSVTAVKGYQLAVRVVDQNNLSATANTTLQVNPKAEPTPTPTPSGDYQYAYPKDISKYKAGTRVLGKDGSIYECKPYPYSGWCSQAAWAYEPGKGVNWKDAWDKR